jgi:oligosaccharyl transferase complex subunit OST4
MISDDTLYSLAIFLGGFAMILIILYHFLEVNSKDPDTLSKQRKADTIPAGKTRS